MIRAQSVRKRWTWPRLAPTCEIINSGVHREAIASMKSGDNELRDSAVSPIAI
jgi:hypothetical protein